MTTLELLQAIRVRLTQAQELKAKGDCAAGVRTYVMDVTKLLAIVELQRAALDHYADQLGMVYKDARMIDNRGVAREALLAADKLAGEE